jgi:hypothetical protein
MMRSMDFSSWQGVFSTLLGLAVFTLIGVGIRVLMMQTIQQRRERMNRQINERLRTLVAAYKVLGGSFTGELTVDPTSGRCRRMWRFRCRVQPGPRVAADAARARVAAEAVKVEAAREAMPAPVAGSGWVSAWGWAPAMPIMRISQ